MCGNTAGWQGITSQHLAGNGTLRLAPLVTCLSPASQADEYDEVPGTDQGKKEFRLAAAFQHGCLREYLRWCLTETG